MSSEAKKKRGESGLANAKASPFRLNGFAPDWEAKARGVYATGPALSGGSAFVRGLIGGLLAERLGFGGFNTSEHRAAHAFDRCTHPMLRDDDAPIGKSKTRAA